VNRLEVFQSQMGKRMLKLPNHYAGILPRVVLGLASIRVQILIRKHHFLARLLQSEEQTVGPATLRTLAILNVDEISLVQQCQWLEQQFFTNPSSNCCSTSITDNCLKNPYAAISTVKEAEPELFCRDKAMTLDEAMAHQSMKHILCIHNWVHMWDNALDYGCAGTIAIQKILRFIAKPLFRDRKCHLCSTNIEINTTYAEHLRTCLSLPVYSIDSVIEAVNKFNDSVFIFSKLL